MDFGGDPASQRLAVEQQADMMTAILQVCRDRTIKKTHTQDDLSAQEKKDFQNCLLKFFETPNHVASVMQRGAQF